MHTLKIRFVLQILQVIIPVKYKILGYPCFIFLYFDGVIVKFFVFGKIGSFFLGALVWIILIRICAVCMF